MTTPIFLNYATRTHTASTSVTPSLPGSRSNGDILFLHAGYIDAFGGTVTLSLSGTDAANWHAVVTQATFASASQNVTRVWARVVDGTESAPTVSASGGTFAQDIFAQVSQYSRDLVGGEGWSTIIGATSTNGGVGSTASCNGITTTGDNSCILYVSGCTGNRTQDTPSGWTERYDNGAASQPANQLGDKAVASSGSASGNISVALSGSASWRMWQIEVKAPAAAGVTGTLDATESGSDSPSVAGKVQVSGTVAIAESGSDTVAIAGSVPAQGVLSITESGPDTASMAGKATVAGTLDAIEPDNDTASFTGSLPIQGALDATEPTADVFTAEGTAPSTGSFDFAEPGPDTASFTGGVLVQGTFGASEPAGDDLAIAAQAVVTGALSVSESGPDVAAMAGQVIVRGTMLASEPANDNASFTGGVTVAGTMAAAEDGVDDAAFTDHLPPRLATAGRPTLGQNQRVVPIEAVRPNIAASSRTAQIQSGVRRAALSTGTR